MGAHRLRQESTMVFQSRTKIENHHAPREYLFKIVFRHKRKPLQIGVLYKVIGNHLTRYNKSLTCGWFCIPINPYVRLYAMLLHNMCLSRDGQMRYFKFKRAHPSTTFRRESHCCVWFYIFTFPIKFGSKECPVVTGWWEERHLGPIVIEMKQKNNYSVIRKEFFARILSLCSMKLSSITIKFSVKGAVSELSTINVLLWYTQHVFSSFACETFLW